MGDPLQSEIVDKFYIPWVLENDKAKCNTIMRNSQECMQVMLGHHQFVEMVKATWRARNYMLHNGDNSECVINTMFNLNGDHDGRGTSIRALLSPL
jgi:hypothetical protein